MKWVFATVAVAVTGAVAASAIYTWAWRDPSGDRQRRLARTDFETVNYAWGSCCQLVRLDRVGDDAWLVTFTTRRKWLGFARGFHLCYVVDLSRFKPSGGLSYDGWESTGSCRDSPP